jgi:sulfite exporter TauE/SafE
MEHFGHLNAGGGPIDAVLLFGTGLAISLGHCLGMCGPLVGSLAAAQRNEGLGWGALAVAQVTHHAGRITSYALIGLVLATFGSTVHLSEYGQGLQGVLALVVGALMVILGLGLLGWLPTRRLIESGRWALLVTRATTGLRRTSGWGARYLMGMANGFLPCGPVYAVAAGTIVASPLAGAGAMILFGLGTVPALLIFAIGAGGLSPALQRGFNRLGGLLVALIGIQLLCRGGAALGWVGHLKLGSVVLW